MGWSLWTGYLLYRGLQRKKFKGMQAVGGADDTVGDDCYETEARETLTRSTTIVASMTGEVESELFSADDEGQPALFARRPNSGFSNLMVVAEEETPSESDTPRAQSDYLRSQSVESSRSAGSLSSAPQPSALAKRRPSSGSLKPPRQAQSVSFGPR